LAFGLPFLGGLVGGTIFTVGNLPTLFFAGLPAFSFAAAFAGGDRKSKLPKRVNLKPAAGIGDFSTTELIGIEPRGIRKPRLFARKPPF
jgi:hypothetical protein